MRRLSIADLMILVPAAAVATLILRSYMHGFYSMLRFLPSIAPDPWGLWRAHFWVHGPASCVVVPAMASLIAMRLRRPRPRLIRFQPGFVACIAVMVSLIPGLVWYANIYHRQGFQKATGTEQAWTSVTYWASTAVLGSWIALYLAKRWRPEPSWIDRLGRALGFYWIFAFFAFYALQWALVIGNLLSGASS